MIPVIKEYRPRRKLRIRSKIRFVVFLAIVLSTVIVILIHSTAKSQVTYRPYEVRYGDTYWDIARWLQAQGYKPNRDIREVVDELIRVSSIPAHELRDGDTIYIPEFEIIKEEEGGSSGGKIKYWIESVEPSGQLQTNKAKSDIFQDRITGPRENKRYEKSS